jgi:hypothetical protein
MGGLSKLEKREVTRLALKYGVTKKALRYMLKLAYGLKEEQISSTTQDLMKWAREYYPKALWHIGTMLSKSAARQPSLF